MYAVKHLTANKIAIRKPQILSREVPRSVIFVVNRVNVECCLKILRCDSLTMGPDRPARSGASRAVPVAVSRDFDGLFWYSSNGEHVQ